MTKRDLELTFEENPSKKEYRLKVRDKNLVVARARIIYYPFDPLMIPNELKNDFLLSLINVKRGFRKKGIGQRLIEAAKAIAKYKNKRLFLTPYTLDNFDALAPLNEQVLTNEELREFYKNHGFTIGFQNSYLIYDPRLEVKPK